MHFTTLAFFLPLALAMPATENRVVARQSATVVTDQLLFSTTLSAFESRRNARNPPTLDWSSDSCSWSPDNPLGFPFQPGCHRHDFGYRNYKAQGRFTDANKLRIDNNFRTDLYNQCRGQTLQGACEALANVYYAAVRAFGRQAASAEAVSAASGDLVKEYEQNLAIYNEIVDELRANGEIE